MNDGSERYRRFRETGDERALEELIRQYSDGLIMYLHAVTGSYTLAEDIAVDTFALLGVKKPADKGGASFKTWLYTIARNLAISRLRREKHSVPLEEDRADEGAVDLLERVITEERRAAVHRAMDRLKPEYRQILWLMYFEEMTAREAGAVMKKSRHATEMLASRARAAMKEILTKEGFGNEE
jgi:RNA polymerase sigma-70 factor (ECF subfamily)